MNEIYSSVVMYACLQETMDMVSPARELSSKIPDKKLQVWAATLLAGELG